MRYGLSVTSFRGLTSGANHYYGHIWRDDDKKIWSVEVWCTMTQGDADHLNSRDGTPYVYRAGDRTQRWNYIKDLLAAALVQTRDRYGSVVLEIGDVFDTESPTVDLAYDPPDAGQVELARHTIELTVVGG